MHPLVVRLQRQKKRWCTDGCGAEQRQLQRQKRISQRQHQRYDAEQHREDVFDQKQRRRPLDVVDDPASFGHYMGQRTEVRIQQHQLCHLAGGLRTRCHGNAAVGIFQRQNVVYAIAGHGHCMSLLLQGVYQLALLLRRYTAEYRAVGGGFFQLAVVFQGCRVYPLVSPADARLGGYMADDPRVVAGNHFDVHALTRKVGKGLRRALPDAVLQRQQCQKLQCVRVQPGRRVGQFALTAGQQQHAPPLGQQRVQYGAQLCQTGTGQNIRRTYDITALCPKAFGAVFVGGVKGDAAGGKPRAATLAEFLAQGTGGVVVWLLTAVKGG